MASVMFCLITRLPLKEVVCVCLHASTGPHTHLGQETTLDVIPRVQALFSVRQHLSFTWHLLNRLAWLGRARLTGQQTLGNLPVSILPALLTSMSHHASFFFGGGDGFWGSNSGSADCSLTNWTIIPAVVKNDFNV